MIIPIVIPARNEQDRIETTILSIRQMFKYSNVDPYIVVVNDGSHDKTSTIVSNLNCFVVDLEDRGYSALGKPELANTHNAGFKFIEENLKENYEFLMVIGSDSTFECNYLSLLLDEMKDENLVMCSGIISGFYTNPNAVRGTGRLIRKSFWESIGSRLPNIYYAWESFPIVYARAKGYKTKTVYEAVMYTDRPPMKSVDWYRYGIGMRENGSIFLYVLLRAFRAAYNINIKQSIRLIRGYFSKDIVHIYPSELRLFTRKSQLNRIFTFLTFRK